MTEFNFDLEMSKLRKKVFIIGFILFLIFIICLSVVITFYK